MEEIAEKPEKPEKELTQKEKEQQVIDNLKTQIEICNLDLFLANERLTELKRRLRQFENLIA